MEQTTAEEILRNLLELRQEFNQFSEKIEGEFESFRPALARFRMMSQANGFGQLRKAMRS